MTHTRIRTAHARHTLGNCSCVTGFLKLFEPLTRMSRAKDKSQKARGAYRAYTQCVCSLQDYMHTPRPCPSRAPPKCLSKCPPSPKCPPDNQ